VESVCRNVHVCVWEKGTTAAPPSPQLMESTNRRCHRCCQGLDCVIRRCLSPYVLCTYVLSDFCSLLYVVSFEALAFFGSKTFGDFHEAIYFLQYSKKSALYFVQNIILSYSLLWILLNKSNIKFALFLKSYIKGFLFN
jgi:hypothetical protein